MTCHSNQILAKWVDRKLSSSSPDILCQWGLKFSGEIHPRLFFYSSSMAQNNRMHISQNSCSLCSFLIKWAYIFSAIFFHVRSMSFHQINWKLCRYFDNQSLSFLFKRITKNLGASRWGSIHDRERFRWWLGSQCPWREGELSRSFEPTALLLKNINLGWYLQKI